MLAVAARPDNHVVGRLPRRLVFTIIVVFLPRAIGIGPEMPS